MISLMIQTPNRGLHPRPAAACACGKHHRCVLREPAARSKRATPSNRNATTPIRPPPPPPPPPPPDDVASLLAMVMLAVFCGGVAGAWGASAGVVRLSASGSAT